MAIAKRHVVVVGRPDGRALAAFGQLNVNGVPSVFGVLGAERDRSCAPTWYRVQLPIRPNGSTGWVAATAVAVATVRTRVVVDISSRHLTLFRAGRRRQQRVARAGTEAA